MNEIVKLVVKSMDCSFQKAGGKKEDERKGQGPCRELC